MCVAAPILLEEIETNELRESAALVKPNLSTEKP
jgi:hypothetical protein